MTRYFVFLGSDYYPSGGMEDYQGAFDTLEQAQRFVENYESAPDELSIDWANIAVMQGDELVKVAAWCSLVAVMRGECATSEGDLGDVFAPGVEDALDWSPLSANPNCQIAHHELWLINGVYYLPLREQ